MTIPTLKQSLRLVTLCLAIVCPAVSHAQRPEKIEIKLRKVNSNSLADKVKQIRLLPIEYRTDAQTTLIDQIKCFDNQYYIQNYFDAFTHSIIITGPDGKIRSVLNRKGKGPGEYVSITDFDVEPGTGKIWINDGAGAKILVYTPDLRHQYSQEIQVTNLVFAPWDERKMVLWKPAPDPATGKVDQICISDLDGHIVSRYLESDPVKGVITGGHLRLQHVAGNIDFWPPFSPDIFRISDNSCSPVFQITFDEPSIQPGTQITSSDHPEVMDQTFFESETHLLIQCMISGKAYLTFYNKTTRSITTIQNPWNSIADDGYLYRILGFIDNRLVLWAINLDIKELVTKLDPTGVKLADKKVLDQIDPESQNSNPILVFVDLK